MRARQDGQYGLFVQRTRSREVLELGTVIAGLMRDLDPGHLRERTTAEAVAAALLEMDRAATEPRLDVATLPSFASDFLSRRLIRRLLDRYPARELPAEFGRRFSAVVDRLGKDDARDLERLYLALSDLRTALDHAGKPAAR
jgi:hypothetical protein